MRAPRQPASQTFLASASQPRQVLLKRPVSVTDVPVPAVLNTD